jgi:acetyl esterase/lipase
MKSYLFVILLLLNSLNTISQDLKMKVWPDGAPESNGITTPEEISDNGSIANVSEAEIFCFLPKKEINTGVAVVICPGGGYARLAMNHEGYDLARWLAERGIAGIVLKYRMPNGHSKVPSDDARRALRMVRANAEKWGIDPTKIGIAGSSAGGHLAATVGTKFDSGDAASLDPLARMSSRPDFMLLLYPVITMKEDFTHLGSRKNMLGEGNNLNLIRLYSNELNVTKETPPTFIVLADNDTGVVPRNSIEFYSALKANQLPAEMHIFAEGGHGFGMRKNNIPADKWPFLFLDWLKTILIYPGNR